MSSIGIHSRVHRSCNASGLNWLRLPSAAVRTQQLDWPFSGDDRMQPPLRRQYLPAQPKPSSVSIQAAFNNRRVCVWFALKENLEHQIGKSNASTSLHAAIHVAFLFITHGVKGSLMLLTILQNTVVYRVVAAATMLQF